MPRNTDTTAATERTKALGAERAAQDPRQLERAARVVRIALELGTLTLTDLGPKAARR